MRSLHTTPHKIEYTQQKRAILLCVVVCQRPAHTYLIWCLSRSAANPTWGDIFECWFKARTSLFTEMWQKRRSSFELRAFENVNSSGIGCNKVSVHHTTHGRMYRRKQCHCIVCHHHIVWRGVYRRGGGLGSSTIFKKFNEPYAPS